MYYHKKFQYPTLHGTNTVPTSEIHTISMFGITDSRKSPTKMVLPLVPWCSWQVSWKSINWFHSYWRGTVTCTYLLSRQDLLGCDVV